MDLSVLLEQLGASLARAEAGLAASPILSGLGLMLGAGALLALAALALASLVRAVFALRRRWVVRRLRRQTDMGARILVVRGGVGRLSAAAAFMHGAMETHLKDYMFGGPFCVVRYPGVLHKEGQARTLLERAQADLIVWADHPRRTHGFINILSRPASAFDPPRTAVGLVMPKPRKSWSEALSRAIAYAAAKQFRPALGRPQDFRPERLSPVVETLFSILAQKPEADAELLGEIEDDACAGALHLASALGGDWIERAVAAAEAALAGVNRSHAPERWVTANIMLGRALKLQAEKQYDPVLLRKAIGYMSEGMDFIRSEPRFRLAESTAQAIGDAQRLLGTRRKFSITGGGL